MDIGTNQINQIQGFQPNNLLSKLKISNSNYFAKNNAAAPLQPMAQSSFQNGNIGDGAIVSERHRNYFGSQGIKRL